MTQADLVERQRRDVEHVLSALPQEIVHADHDGHVHGDEDAGLVRRLYTLYSKPAGVSHRTLRGLPDAAGQQAFVETLSRANTSRWSWSPDWKLVGRQGRFFLIQRGEGAIRAVHPLSYDGPNAAGSGRLLEEREQTDGDGAWYFAMGETGTNPEADHTVRLYWSVIPEGAAPLLNAITRELNRNCVPFSSKVLKDPSSYGRADAGVLYVPRFAWDRTAPIIADIHSQVKRYLSDSTPSFTKTLARGLGLAEDPGKGASFGMTRCETLLRLAKQAGDAAPIDRTAHVLDRLAAEGIGPGRMHLRPETKRDYSLDDFRLFHQEK